MQEYLEKMDLCCQVTIKIPGRENNEKLHKIKQ